MIFRRIFGCLCILWFLIGCHERGANDGQTSLSKSSLSMLFAPTTPLRGEPNIFLLTLTAADGDQLLEKGGDLPLPGAPLTFSELPLGSGILVTLTLYKDKFLDEFITHRCSADQTVDLSPGETSSTQVSCLAVSNSLITEPVVTFFRFAELNATLEEKDLSEWLGSRNWQQDLLFSNLDGRGNLISLSQTQHGIYFSIGGEVTYYSDEATNWVAQWRENRPLHLSPISGRRLSTFYSNGSLQLIGKPQVFYEDQILKAAIEFRFTNDDATLESSGWLLEAEPMSQFTVVSYNVENLFDGTDVNRNAHYGDYRISANENGQSSNYGNPVEWLGVERSFTEIKIMGIRAALLGIDKNGPAIVALQEVESQEALRLLFENLQDLGYNHYQFTDWADDTPNAIGAGFISKFPILNWQLIETFLPPGHEDRREPLRRPLKIEVDVLGHRLTLYNNHWKSKGGPESLRKAQAEVLKADIDLLLQNSPQADFLVLGDLNSDYNERVIIEGRHNDTDGVTGINNVLLAQGNEVATARGENNWNYNLHYELDRWQRRTAFHGAFGWSSMDHIVVGSGVFDQRGITYIDNSFQIASPNHPHLRFLFNDDGTTNRWHSVRINSSFTVHSPGGFSDHVPVFARFHVRREQGPRRIQLYRPGWPDASD